MDSAEREPVAFRVRPMTVKLLRLWCTLRDLPEGEMISACLSGWIRQSLSERPKEFGEAFHAAVRTTTSAAWHKAYRRDPDGKAKKNRPPLAEVPDPPQPADVEAKTRQLRADLDVDLVAGVRLFVVMTDSKPSEFADQAIRNWINRLASLRGDEFYDGFMAAVKLCHYPEDPDDPEDDAKP